MKFSLFSLGLLATSLAFAGAPPDEPPPVPDTVCPADGSTLITGGPWAFQLHAGDVAGLGAATVGTFTAVPGGTLTSTLTVTKINGVTRRATVGGRYILYSDCSGGEVMIMLNGFAMQLEFVWAENFTQMLFVSDALNSSAGAFSTIALTGNARRAPTACPAGLGNPLNILDKTTWSFRLSPAYYRAIGGVSSVGTFRPFISGSLGLLTAVETTSTTLNVNQATIARLQHESGRYVIYPDCSGGEIMLMGRQPGSIQLEFVFAGTGFEQMYLLADDAKAPQDGATAGQAVRY